MLRTSLAVPALLAPLAVAAAVAPTAVAAGGTGGSPFSIQCSASQHLERVTVRSGNRIDALGIRCSGPGGNFSVGGSGGSPHAFLDPGEEIAEVRGWTGKCKKKSRRICALRFAARSSADGPLRLSTQYGKYHSSADAFTLKVPANRELYGFKGRSGKELDAIELLTRPRNEGHTRHSFSATPFVQALNVALGGTKLHLNNLGERHGNSWLREEDSWVSVFGATRRFTLEEQSYRRKHGLYRHYFYANDINATKADVATSGNAFVLRVNFEGDGREIKGLCRRKKVIGGGYGKCPGRHEGDGNTPDVHWKAPRVDVTLLPGAVGGELVFSVSAVHVRGDFKMTGICGSGGECKKLLGNWETALKFALETAVHSVLERAAVRDAEARITRPMLIARGISAPLRTAGLDGNDLVVTY